jgi:hypothetical protein
VVFCYDWEESPTVNREDLPNGFSAPSDSIGDAKYSVAIDSIDFLSMRDDDIHADEALSGQNIEASLDQTEMRSILSLRDDDIHDDEASSGQNIEASPDQTEMRSITNVSLTALTTFHLQIAESSPAMSSEATRLKGRVLNSTEPPVIVREVTMLTKRSDNILRLAQS